MSSRRRLPIGPVALVAALCWSAPAVAFELACPSTATIKPTLAAPMGDWRIVDDQRSTRLVSVSIFSGQPEDLTSLAPVKSNRGGATWTLDAGQAHSVACNYEGGALTRPLPAGLSTCRVTYKPASSRTVIAAATLACR
jgi:hypothetical protein